MGTPEPPADGPDLGAGDGQFGSRTVELLRAHFEQGMARGGRGAADVRASAGDAGAAAGSAMIGRNRGIAFDHGKAFDRDAELLSGDLLVRHLDAGAHIDAAGEERDPAVNVDSEEAVDVGGRRGLCGSLCGQVSTKREAHDQRASGPEKIAAGEGGGIFHFGPPWAFAARITALKIRVCVPQRQRLPARPVFTCSSVG